MGAGFAQEFGGPSSAELFDRIKRKLQVEGDELPQLILKKLDEYYGENIYNFETFIAALELIETYVSSATAGNWKSFSESSLIPALSNLDDSIFHALKADAMKRGNSLSFHLRDLIEECIVSILVGCSYDTQFVLRDQNEVKYRVMAKQKDGGRDKL